MIQPTPGRVLWFYPGFKAMKRFAIYGTQPMAATIAFAYNERNVNLCVTDHAGVQHPVSGVQLLQDEDPRPSDSDSYATWMPYQRGQAAKTEKLEAELAGRPPSTGPGPAEYKSDA